MQTEDVIELGSSDEEPGPPPPKKMNVRNAMVHIPTKFHGVTIKPLKATPDLPKLGKNITITKTTGASSSAITDKVKSPDKPLQKLAAAKKKAVARKLNQTAQILGKVFNPLSQQKKSTMPVGNSTITKLKSPILIRKIPLIKPQPLQRLPPSITIKKTGTTVKKPAPTMNVLPKTVAKVARNLSKIRKVEVVQTVELDDDEASTSSNKHHWYVRPEDQTRSSSDKHETPLHDDNETSQETAAVSQENTNNKEPEAPKYIEITIEDSPIKPAKTKRTRELSTEKVITIDDSPNKGSVVSEDVAEASDGESNTVKKVPHSKKKLKYASDLQSVEENKTIEIEIEPFEQNQPIQLDIEANKESRVISLTPEIMEVEQASVEIAQNKEGAVSVIQTKPLQPKQNAKSAPKREPAIKSEFHPIYQSFISLCIQLENSNDMEKILEKKIKPYYRQAPKEYTESEEFLDMVSSKITAMEAAPEKMYLYIKDIVDELNLQRKYLKQMPEDDKSSDKDSFLYDKENELDPNKQRQIRKLEKTLKKLNRAIQKLENQEVDFDDEEDSVYLLTEKYKERMVRVHAKFCQLTNTKMPSQPRLVIDPRPGLSSAPAKRLEAWINKKDEVVFPDFHDVLRCVREANEQENLGWNEACIMEEARDLFVRCGRKLQRRRQENEWRIATSRIQPNSDPAEQSEDLRRQLEANRRLANTKETEVLDKFCDRQSQLKLEAEEIDDKEAEESPVESEEEDNDDSSSLESKQKRKDRLRRLLQEQSKKTVPTKGPQTERDVNEEIENVQDVFIENVKENKSETVNEEDKIQSLSDDSNEIGSDMDELHLLQKLHSDNEIQTGSTSDSGSETPIAISDSLDSSSEDGKQTTQQPGDVISIENSSYSDESDSQKNDPKNKKKQTVSTKHLTEESKEIEGTSSVVNNPHTLENMETGLSSSDGESILDDNTNSAKSDNSSKVSSGKDGKTLDKDFELSITSESAELCMNINDYSKPSDAEDDLSTNSDIVQYEELLKEHNSDPLLKAPDLIPQDPSDKLFDSLVIKHFNDPLIKKTLKGSESSNGSPFPPEPENSNSDSQSTEAPPTVEQAKKDLMESSVDTEEILDCNSPSTQVVDKYLEKLSRDKSEGSQSSDDLLMKAEQNIGLLPHVLSPVTFALEREVNLARQTKAWPRFRDECSSFSSADDDNTGDDSHKHKTNESEKNGSDEKEFASESKSPAGEYDQTGNNTSDAKDFSADSKSAVASDSDNVFEEMDAESNEMVCTKDSTDAVASSSKCTIDLSEADNATFSSQSPEDIHEAMDIAESDATLTEVNDSSVESSEMVCTKDSTDAVASSSRCTIDVSEADNVTFSSKYPEDTDEVMDIAESDATFTKTNDSSRQSKDNAEPVTNVVSKKTSDDTNETLIHQEGIGSFDFNHGNDNGSELVSNGNLNINMDISEILHSDANVSQQSDRGDLDELNEHLSVQKGDCGDGEAIPRTISNVCSEGND